MRKRTRSEERDRIQITFLILSIVIAILIIIFFTDSSIVSISTTAFVLFVGIGYGEHRSRIDSYHRIVLDDKDINTSGIVTTACILSKEKPDAFIEPANIFNRAIDYYQDYITCTTYHEIFYVNRSISDQFTHHQFTSRPSYYDNYEGNNMFLMSQFFKANATKKDWEEYHEFEAQVYEKAKEIQEEYENANKENEKRWIEDVWEKYGIILSPNDFPLGKIY